MRKKAREEGIGHYYAALDLAESTDESMRKTFANHLVNLIDTCREKRIRNVEAAVDTYLGMMFSGGAQDDDQDPILSALSAAADLEAAPLGVYEPMDAQIELWEKLPTIIRRLVGMLRLARSYRKKHLAALMLPRRTRRLSPHAPVVTGAMSRSDGRRRFR